MERPDNPTLYHPAAALVLFKPEGRENDLYIEYYDMDASGCPVNPRPLSLQQASGLAKALNSRKSAAKAFLKPSGLLPASVLHIDPAENGSVVWYTKPSGQRLHFTENLNINSGVAPLPALVWKADKKHLSVYALKAKRKPNATTPLYHAPFFNLYRNGSACMGTVNVQINAAASLEAFISQWEAYFFGSYFSHLIDSHNPITGNLTLLYKNLIGKAQAFPMEVLQPTGKTLNDLLR